MVSWEMRRENLVRVELDRMLACIGTVDEDAVERVVGYLVGEVVGHFVGCRRSSFYKIQ